MNHLTQYIKSVFLTHSLTTGIAFYLRSYIFMWIMQSIEWWLSYIVELHKCCRTSTSHTFTYMDTINPAAYSRTVQHKVHADWFDHFDKCFSWISQWFLSKHGTTKSLSYCWWRCGEDARMSMAADIEGSRNTVVGFGVRCKRSRFPFTNISLSK